MEVVSRYNAKSPSYYMGDIIRYNGHRIHQVKSSQNFAHRYTKQIIVELPVLLTTVHLLLLR